MSELKATNPVEQKLLDHFTESASESLKERVAAGNKTIQGAMKFIYDWAGKQKRTGNCLCATDEEVFGQMMHYFEEDTLDFEKKPEPPKGAVATTPAATAAKKEEPKPDPLATLSLDDIIGGDKPKPEDASPPPDVAAPETSDAEPEPEQEPEQKDADPLDDLQMMLPF